MTSMNLRVLASVSSALTLQAFGQFQTPIDEKWVLTENKDTFLQNLTPGTDDHYFSMLCISRIVVIVMDF